MLTDRHPRDVGQHARRPHDLRVVGVGNRRGCSCGAGVGRSICERLAPPAGDHRDLADPVELVAAEIAEHEQRRGRLREQARQEGLVGFEDRRCVRGCARRRGECGHQAGRHVGARAFVTTGAAAAMAAASSLVVVVLPFVAETKTTCRPAARARNASGQIAMMTRPPMTRPSPRRSDFDRPPASLPRAVAARNRTDLAVSA